LVSENPKIIFEVLSDMRAENNVDMIEYKGTTESEPTVIYHDESGPGSETIITSYYGRYGESIRMASHGDMYGEFVYGFHQLMETYTRCLVEWYHRCH
jgi:hypothetical protein